VGEGIPIPGCIGSFCNELPLPVFPTPFYEVLMGLAIFAMLWGFRHKIKIPGLMWSIYLIFNGIERFLIESIRVNSEYHALGLSFTQAELISTILIILGITGIFWSLKNGNKYAVS
jgi:prolipoprotein diacylglyceryltransferase